MISDKFSILRTRLWLLDKILRLPFIKLFLDYYKSTFEKYSFEALITLGDNKIVPTIVGITIRA